MPAGRFDEMGSDVRDQPLASPFPSFIPTPDVTHNARRESRIAIRFPAFQSWSEDAGWPGLGSRMDSPPKL
jgi:hypothetical protein